MELFNSILLLENAHFDNFGTRCGLDPQIPNFEKNMFSPIPPFNDLHVDDLCDCGRISFPSNFPWIPQIEKFFITIMRFCKCIFMFVTFVWHHADVDGCNCACTRIHNTCSARCTSYGCGFNLYKKNLLKIEKLRSFVAICFVSFWNLGNIYPK